MHSIFPGLIFVFLMSATGSAYSQVDTYRSVDPVGSNISVTTAAGKVIVKTPERIQKNLKRGLKYYKKKKYGKAYELLSELAQWGYKTPQTVLGFMYLKGQHVDQSNLRGMAWLGVANEVKQKDANAAFEEVYALLGDEHKTMVDKKVAEYIAMNGLEAQNIKCRKFVPVGSNISDTVCTKRKGSNSVLHPIE